MINRQRRFSNGLQRQLLGATCILFVIWLLWKPGYHVKEPFSGKHETSQSVFNTTLGFQKIFAINLPSRTDRRDALALAASLTDIHLDWIDGTIPSDSLNKFLPQGERSGINPGYVGSWRAHLNAITSIVNQNVTTALILEDDADWDVRLKPQLQRQSSVMHSYSPFNPSSGGGEVVVDSPYRTRPFWDILWLGHCGSKAPKANATVMTISNDLSVPAKKYFKPHKWALPGSDPLEPFPEHTRLVHEPVNVVCTTAYAVTQRAARMLLREFGMKKFDSSWDVMLGRRCDGEESGTTYGEGARVVDLRCLVVSPPLMAQHVAARHSSDNAEHGTGGELGEPHTPGIRKSVRVNAGRLVWGKEAVDQWPD